MLTPPIEDLTLAAIDGMRHLVTSEQVVNAAAFAARAAYDDVMAYRFVTALVMTNNLERRSEWRTVLRHLAELENGAAR
jgi:hypothetical protein